MALWGVFSALAVSGCRSGMKGRERRVWTPWRGCVGVSVPLGLLSPGVERVLRCLFCGASHLFPVSLLTRDRSPVVGGRLRGAPS